MNIFGRESLKAPFKLPANIVSKAGLRHARWKKEDAAGNALSGGGRDGPAGWVWEGEWKAGSG